MNPDRIVWADLRTNRLPDSHACLIPAHWRVEKSETPDYITYMIARLSPGLLVFEFDRPDIPSLTSLGHIRRRFAAIPLLMLTEYHSEALAVWALRNRVSDYLVVPVTQQELADSVAEAIATPGAGGANCPRGGNPIPNELRFHAVTCHKTAAAVMYVEAHYHEPIREESVAEVCGMSVSAFSRTFRKEQATTFREYLQDYRIRKACELLQHPGVNVTDAAFTVGFNDASYFAKRFKQAVGKTPRVFQREKSRPMQNITRTAA